MPDSSAGVVDFEIVLSDAMVGCDGRSPAKNAVLWSVCEDGCVHNERESREQEKVTVCSDTCNGTGGKGKCRDANEGRSES